MTVDPKYKRYRDRHPGKIRAYTKLSWERIKSGEKPKPDRKAISRRYYEKNKKKHKELMKRWRSRNPGYDTERMRIWRAAKHFEELFIIGKVRIKV